MSASAQSPNGGQPRHTLETLAHLPIKIAGAGRNLREASAPAILDIAGNCRLLTHARVFRGVDDHDATRSQSIGIAGAFTCNTNHCCGKYEQNGADNSAPNSTRDSGGSRLISKRLRHAGAVAQVLPLQCTQPLINADIPRRRGGSVLHVMGERPHQVGAGN